MNKLSLTKPLKYLASVLFFYRIRDHIRNTRFKPVIYDAFVRSQMRDICLIGPYYSRAGLEGSVCMISDIIVQADLVDDPEKNCLVVLFKLPAGMDMNKPFAYIIKRGETEILRNVYEPAASKAHSLSISTLFKYEKDFLKEWLDFHLSKGVEHFYLYENNVSPDSDVARILAPYVEQGIVTHIMWPYPYHLYNFRLRKFWPHDAYSYTQHPQINHVLYKFGGESKWILNCDIDEYFYSPAGKSFADILAEAENDGVSSVRIPGFWFGGNKEELALLKENGVLKTFIHSEKNSTSAPKCIFKADDIALASVHNSVMHINGKEWNSPSEILRFNHYRGLGWKKRLDPAFAREVEDRGILAGR